VNVLSIFQITTVERTSSTSGRVERPMSTDLAALVRANGYAIWTDFLDHPCLTRLRHQSDALLSTEHARNYPKSTRIWDLHIHGGAFVDVLTDTRLVPLLDALLGEGHLLSDYSLNQVQPGQPLDDWHIDYPYNEMTAPVSGAILGLQCVLAMDRFSDDNGATQLIAQTHHSPRSPTAPFGAPVVFDAAPGSLLVMAAATWHRSGLNRSQGPRAAVLMSFVERWVKPMSAPTDGLEEPIPQRLRTLLALDAAPETINGVPL
jgi:hypothetical protein